MKNIRFFCTFAVDTKEFALRNVLTRLKFMNLKTIFEWLNRKGRRTQSTEVSIDTHVVLRQIFSSSHIDWTMQTVNEDSGEKDYHFTYQHGDFHLLAREGRSFVRIHFLFFLEAPMGHLDNVRYACNEFNQHYGEFKAVYSLDEKQHHIHLHIMSSFRLTSSSPQQDEEFVLTLSQCFEAARVFRQIYDSIQEHDIQNLEENNAMTKREMFLARQTEWTHQQMKFRWSANETEHQTIGRLLETLFEGKSYKIGRLRIITEKQKILTDVSEVANFDLTDVLIRKAEDETALFVRETATLILEASFASETMQEYLIHLHAEDEAEGVLYMRLTFVEPQHPVSPTHSQSIKANTKDGVRSFLIACDSGDIHHREAEFEYQWRELQDAIDNGRKLSEEQLFLSFCKWPNVGYSLYWGRRFFESLRFYDALAYLENAYKALNGHFHYLDKKGRDRFYELCYYIGRCYEELHCYQRAYFFLDAAFSQNNLRYTSAYVNCLVNSEDFRALHVIEGLMRNLQISLEQDDEEENQDRLRSFIKFLERRKGYVLIGQHRLDEAEQLFQELLDDPGSEEYALTELAYIQKLRDEQPPS